MAHRICSDRWMSDAMAWLSRALLVSVVCVVGAAAAGGALTAQEPAGPPYRIACRLEVASDASLTAPLITGVRGQMERAFAALFGADEGVRFIEEPDFASLPPLDQATAEQLAKRWTGPDRLIYLSVGRSGNHYLLRAREYDPRFQMLGPVSEIATMQRALVADAAGRVALQSFSPHAIVRSATGTNVELEFIGNLANYRDWLGLASDVGLQVLREPVAARAGSRDARPQRYRGSFIALRSWQGNRAEGELIGPDRLFRDVDSPDVRYVARPVRGNQVPTQVRVVRKDSRQPQPDCEVFVSPQQYSTDPSLLRGLTDRDGSLLVQGSGAGLQFVSIRYEDLVLRAPILPGASGNPVVFELPTRGRRAEFIRPLRQILQEIEDQYLVDLRLLEELKAKVEAKETAEVRRLIERGRNRRINVSEIEARIREIELRADAEGEDVREAAAQVRHTATQKAARPLDQTLVAYSDWADKFDKKASVESLNARINELQEQMDWEALVPVFEQWVQAEPDNQKVAQELRLLKNDLRIKSPEHGKAREFVNSVMNEFTAADSATQWSDVERQTKVLLESKDHLTLMKVRRSLVAWAQEIAQQAKAAGEQVQAAGQDEERARALRDRLDELDQLNQSILKLHKEIQAFLDTLKL